jgi:hypothetical protein
MTSKGAENNNAELIGVMYRHIKFRRGQSSNTDVVWNKKFHHHLADIRPPFFDYISKLIVIWNHGYFIHLTFD